MKEYEVIILGEDVPEHDLKKGNPGTIVLIHNDGEAYVVEFDSGIVATLKPNQLKDAGTYLLQCLDCNCNDCVFMERDFEKYNRSLVTHEKWQRDYFDGNKARIEKAAASHKEKGNLDKHDALMKEANAMKFQFNRSTALLQFGNCSKLEKPVTFQSNTLQLDTQTCFKHRKDR